MITIDNFFINTKGTFKGCKIPKRDADYISYANREVSSKYWYGEDKKGKYVVRLSDHWVYIKDFKGSKEKDCKTIASCKWNLKTNKKIEKTLYFRRYIYEAVAGKIYLENLKPNNYESINL